jgi:hypothetical protein
MRGLRRGTIELINFARELLVTSHPMTLRQLHYAILRSVILERVKRRADNSRSLRSASFGRSGRDDKG